MNKFDPTKWVVFHNGKTAQSDTIAGLINLAQGLRTETEAHLAAKRLKAAIEAELAEDDFESVFQEATVKLVMKHIDRMNDICPDVDPATRIIESFTSQFNPILDAYFAVKFPGRELVRKANNAKPE